MASSPPSKRVVPFRVIVCGLHRTGTKSIRAALRQLGFHDCYHFLSVTEQGSNHAKLWVRALEAKYAGKGSFSKADWDELLGNYQACVDVPAVLFSTDLAELYPDAKVVILNRDPEKWYDSALNSVNISLTMDSLFVRLTKLYCRLFDVHSRDVTKVITAIFTERMDFDMVREKDKAIAWFEAQYDEFRSRIPPERRIEYRVQDGWKPLCQHLGVDVPTVKDADGNIVEAPFPRVNDRQEFFTVRDMLTRQALERANTNALAMVGKMALIGGLVYVAIWLQTVLAPASSK
ncbi:hypothetical protein CDD80_7145 [Ophiocordyceps camponoti-rufipedis]|uniref:NAD dependent epimerase/dehydratase n=1 Tax=Ophiocordyceps camponoti-rufipedis TaxID=2004952 RepID=A0A2C5ZEX4_9HYPO|nr:hypothetical protein CDD80_7145 [Ophiocordyceps camponoti-rufipedis]